MGALGVSPVHRSSIRIIIRRTVRPSAPNFNIINLSNSANIRL